jgi:type II secretory pathway pseudopilin PulG
MNKAAGNEKGFSLVEGVIVILGIGIILAIAVPRITTAMRQYRLNIATRQVVDTLRRARMQASSENVSVAMAVDLEGRRVGLAFLDDDGKVTRTEFVPLPQGVDFQQPPDVDQTPDGKAVDGPLSFAYDDEAKACLQAFDSRGFPAVNFGDSITILIGDGRDYRAVTMTSVGGVRTYTLDNMAWTDTQYRDAAEDRDGDTTVGGGKTDGKGKKVKP